MRMYEIISKKKRGLPLAAAEIRFAVEGFTRGAVPDYQMAALMMAVFFNGMDARETTELTMAMADSGEKVDLSGLTGITVDKHSTGGVGDKTTLVVAPIAAALGLTVAKMSGRGLGHTGGTVDKLEAIPGFRTDLPGEEFLSIVARHGLCIAGQSANLAPADKKLYALRDVTATVDSVPLIASSIMSKKIAAGASCILLDVKTGSGAFMKTLEDSRALARAMVDIGTGCGRKTAALITDMSAPLGAAIGNSLELIEAVRLLRGESDGLSQDLTEVCHALAAHLLLLAEGLPAALESVSSIEHSPLDRCRARVTEAIQSGAALRKLADMVEAQGGRRDYVENPSTFPRAPHTADVLSPWGGYISEMDAEGIGLAAMTLGAGREKPQDPIDYSAGIILHAKTGSRVEKGRPIATLHTSRPAAASPAAEKLLASLTFSHTPPPERVLVWEFLG